jgi:hypothetical protein
LKRRRPVGLGVISSSVPNEKVLLATEPGLTWLPSAIVPVKQKAVETTATQVIGSGRRAGS